MFQANSERTFQPQTFESIPGFFNLRLGVEKSKAEKSGVEKFMVEKFGVIESRDGKFTVKLFRVERFGVEAWG